MESPDGHGSSTGEGRKAALLLLRGGSNDAVDSEGRASILPSANALRPDSHLNLGWYRPATPDDGEEESVRRGPWSEDQKSAHTDEHQARRRAAGARLDLDGSPAPGEAADSLLGARRPRNTPASSARTGRAREAGPGRKGLARLQRWAVALLTPGAWEVRKQALGAVIGTLLLATGASATVVALGQWGGPHRGGRAERGSAFNVSQVPRQFLSEVTSRLGALDELKRAGGTSVALRSASHTRRATGTARARVSETKRTRSVRISRRSGSSTRAIHAVATAQSVSQVTHGADGESGSTAARETPTQPTPVGQTPVQETSTPEPVHYQPPTQSAGPGGLGSQVGGNCNPKCS